MKKLLLFIVILAVVGVGLVFAYRKVHGEHAGEAGADEAIKSEAAVEKSAEGGVQLKLDEAAQKRLGVETAAAAAGVAQEVLTASARVLDGAALSTAVLEARTAQAEFEAARKDFERKKGLFEQGRNASASAVEQAEALVEHAKLTVETARAKLVAAWGPAVAGRADLPALANALLGRESALVRIDLLPTDKLTEKPKSVSLVRPDGDAVTSAELLGPAPATESSLAGPSFLALVTTNASQLTAGSLLVARVPVGPGQNGTVIPRNAVVRHAGLGWAYIKTGGETFARKPVPLEHPNPEGWVVSGEWKEPVVVAGAQSLLSEELKGSIHMQE